MCGLGVEEDKRYSECVVAFFHAGHSSCQTEDRIWVWHTYQGLPRDVGVVLLLLLLLKVGSCCQGRWCVILSPLCLLPVGQGLLEQGVVDSTEWRGGEGSEQARKESGQTHSAAVAGQQLGYLSPVLFFHFSLHLCALPSHLHKARTRHTQVNSCSCI